MMRHLLQQIIYSILLLELTKILGQSSSLSSEKYSRMCLILSMSTIPLNLIRFKEMRQVVCLVRIWFVMCLILSMHRYTLQNVHTASEINPERMMWVNTSKKICKCAAEKKNHGNKIFKIKSFSTLGCCFEKLLHVLKKFKHWSRHRWLNNTLIVRGKREK